MNTNSPIQTDAPADSMKMLRAMVGIGIACAFMIVMTFQLTLPRIERNKAEALEKAIFKVLPRITKKKTYHLNENRHFVAIDASEKKAQRQMIHAGFDQNDKLIGFAIEASGMGFADVLRVLYGYDPDKQKIVGFYVLESKETPGLGDKIEKDTNFLANFKELDVSLNEEQNALKHTITAVKHGTKENPWELDGITGATISSRAVGNIIGNSTQQVLPLIYKNKQTFKAKNN